MQLNGDVHKAWALGSRTKALRAEDYDRKSSMAAKMNGIETQDLSIHYPHINIIDSLQSNLYHWSLLNSDIGAILHRLACRPT